MKHDTHKTALRIATINMNGLPKHDNHPKNGLLREAINTHQIDVLGLSEINLKWDRIYPSNRLKQRTARWWEHCHCSYAYNYQDLSTAVYQPGGTALLSLNSSSSRVLPSTMSDPTGLGRWTSTLYNGKQNIRFRIIQLYCPPTPSKSSFNSSYAQQHRYFMAQDNHDCPRSLFFEHLSQFLVERLQAQEQLLVMGDFNHVVDTEVIVNFLQQHQLHNIHQTLHQSYHTHIPTHSRGSQTIDAIFATPGITAVHGGFLGFRVFPSDHRLIWCDIAFHTIFGHLPANIIPATRRRLKCEDPRSVKTFCSTYINLLKKSNAISSAESLYASISGPLTTHQQREYERIDSLRVQFMLQAERSCRKFKVGGVEFSPKLQAQRDRITLWKNVLSKKNGSKVSLSLLTRLEKK